MKYFLLTSSAFGLPLYWYSYLTQSESFFFTILPILIHSLLVVWGVYIATQLSNPIEKWFEYTVFGAACASTVLDIMNFYDPSIYQEKANLPVLMTILTSILFLASVWVFRKQIYWILLNLIFVLIANTYFLTTVYKNNC